MDDDGRTGALLKASQAAFFAASTDEAGSFSALSEQIPAPVALLNPIGEIIYVNSAWSQQLEFEHRACLGKSIIEFIDAKDGRPVCAEMLRPTFDKPVEHVELALVTGTGKTRWFEYFAFLHQTCIRVYLDPIGIRRELALLKEKLEVEEARQHFYACVSHELRTSVHGVLGMAELLAQTDLDQRQREYVELLCVSGRHLSSMSSDLLSYARLKAPGFQLEVADVPLRSCMQSVVDEFLPLARQKNVQLRGMMDTLPEYARADITRIRQIFINLVHNALKFTDTGYIAVGISSVRRIGQRHYELHCYVEDTGRGIAPDQLAHLFTPFWRAGRQRDSGGLGLSICAQLVQLMGGQITVNSEPGIGSTVVFTLRVGVADGGGASNAD